MEIIGLIIGLVCVIFYIININNKLSNYSSKNIINKINNMIYSNRVCDKCGSRLEGILVGDTFLWNGMGCNICHNIICGNCEKMLGKPESCPSCGGKLGSLTLNNMS